MKRIVDGVSRFRTDAFSGERSLSRRIVEEGQKSQTLVISCSTSRDASPATSRSGSGAVFVRCIFGLPPHLNGMSPDLPHSSSPRIEGYTS